MNDNYCDVDEEKRNSKIVSGVIVHEFSGVIRAKSLHRLLSVYNAWLSWAKANPTESNYPESQDFLVAEEGLEPPTRGL
jgi:phage anti-repressor protein